MGFSQTDNESLNRINAPHKVNLENLVSLQWFFSSIITSNSRNADVNFEVRDARLFRAGVKFAVIA